MYLEVMPNGSKYWRLKYRIDGEAEVPELMRKIAAYDGDIQTRLALQLLALTFVRTGELRYAEWVEIDEDKAEWRIPAEKMKMRTQHVVPLSTQALDVIRQLRQLNGQWQWVLPSRSNSKQPYLLDFDAAQVQKIKNGLQASPKTPRDIKALQL